MSPLLALRLVTYLVVGDGIAALVLAGLISPLGAGLVAAGILAGWWLEGARERGEVRPVLALGLVAVAGLALAVDLTYLAASFLDGLVHVLLFVILARLFLCRRRGDLRDAGLLSFFLLVAASSVTFSMVFFAVFLAFLVLGTWMLMLHHIVGESEKAGRQDLISAGLDLRGRMIGVGLGAAVGTCFVTGVLFFVIPRVGQATLPFRSQVTPMVTGFSDRVDLGAFGEIETDRTVVMRVHFPDGPPDPGALSGLRWRGIVFDRFDGRTWVVHRPGRHAVVRAAGESFQVGVSRGRGRVVRHEVYLDPIGTEVIFAAPRVLRVDLRAGAIDIDDMGSLSVSAAAARLHYVVDSELELPPPPGTRVSTAGATFSPAERARYLQLPRLSSDIPRLAREVTAGSRDPYEAASRLTRFLSTSYRYTLSKKAVTLDPLQEFLFVRRAGNCEYFSAALAVMLRSLDIPARVVGGFQRGEWNPYGGYFMVRLSDAHAWVEAHFDGLGWVTLDPSPRADALPEEGPGALSLYLDAARMRWYRYVVNWSLQDQRVMVSAIQRQAQDFRPALAWLRGGWQGKPGPVVVGALLAAAVLGWVIWRRHRMGPTGGLPARMPGFYERALRLLARRGLVPAAAETARQFCARAGLAAPASAEPLARITRAYEQARFGAATLSDIERSDVEQCLAELGVRLCNLNNLGADAGSPSRRRRDC